MIDPIDINLYLSLSKQIDAEAERIRIRYIELFEKHFPGEFCDMKCCDECHINTKTEKLEYRGESHVGYGGIERHYVDLPFSYLCNPSLKAIVVEQFESELLRREIEQERLKHERKTLWEELWKEFGWL